MSREIKFRAWDKDKKLMITQKYRAASEVLKEGYAQGWTIMQFTGLKDKNGIEIYEGDILKFKDEILKPIEWAGAGFVGLDMFNELTDPGLKNVKVIGNIYSNPVLKKKGKSNV